MARTINGPTCHVPRLGGIHWGSLAAGLPGPVPDPDQDDASSASKDRRDRRMESHEADGPRNIWCLGRADQSTHQYHLCVLPHHRERLMALLCRPSDGVPGGSLGGGTRDRSSTLIVTSLCR